MKGFQVKACIMCIISKTGYLKFSILDQKVLKNILKWLKKKNQGKKWMFDSILLPIMIIYFKTINQTVNSVTSYSELNMF